MFQRLCVVFAAVVVAVAIQAARMPNLPDSPALIRNDEPGGTDADAKLARTNPDEYAWQLFFYINRQASNKSAGVPDLQETTFRDDNPGTAVVWESWGLASGDQESEVFNGCTPKPWKSLTNRQAIPGKVLSLNLTESADDKLQTNTSKNITPGQEVIFVNPRGLIANEVEIRYNQATYNTILQDRLWNRELINNELWAAQKAHKREFVRFPSGAKAVKAAWVELCQGNTNCPDIKRYHWRQVSEINGSHVYGLAALHIMTKEKGMPHWFWADFIHEDCIENKAPCVLPASQAPDGPMRDSTTVSSAGIRAETVGTPWQYYRLMGTETAFQTAGHDNTLSDPLIETESRKTSCITCHDYASTHPIDPKVVRMQNLPTLNLESIKVVGVPKESVLSAPAPSGGTGGARQVSEYIQSGFLWSMELLAQSQQSCKSK